MNIAIDGYEANIEQRVGIGRYAFEILRHIYGLKPEHDFTVYLPSAPLADMPEATSWWRYRVLRPRTLWTFFALPRALSKDKPDVIFSPTHYVPRFVRIRRVMAIMDTSYLKYPHLFRREDLHKLVNWTSYAARVAEKIVTISEHSKRAIIEAYGGPTSRVVVTYPGMSTLQKTTSTFPLPKNYILSVGTIQPRKNYVRLIEAVAKILPDFDDLQLVIVGKKGWMWQDSLTAPKKLGIENSVQFLDFVPDGLLPTLYKHARCFALVSLYEGFGLPVVEAMANRCPVVVSNVSSIPEIAGSAAIYVDPNNVDTIVKGLRRALTEDNSERIRQGIVQTKKFSWEKAARKTLKVLEDVGRGSV